MKRPRRRVHALAVSVVALVVVSGSFVGVSGSRALSQAPRAIRLIVPYPPGGGIDALARILATEIGRAQGPVVAVENRPGAGSEIGTEAVVRASPDGSTLLTNNNALVILPHLRKLSYDPLADLEPICNLGSTPSLVVVNSASPYHTLDDLLRAARAKPGALTFGSAPGGAANVGFEMLAHAAGVWLTFVPFGGTPPAVNALLGRHIDVVAMVDYPAVAGQLRAGTLRALAAGSRRRIEAQPDVPTVAESGYPDYEAEVWYGLFAPARTPPEIISQLASWYTSAVRSPEARAKLAAQQISPVALCGTDFTAYLRKQSDEYGRAISDANIKAE